MLGHRMSGWSRGRVQLCGRFAVELDGDRVEDRLPGRRGRLLFAYLVLHRGRAVPRDELLMAGWGADASARAVGNALSVALSKLRHGLGSDRLQGRTEVELRLPPATFVDVEAALEGAHRAETAIAEGRWAQAWGPAGIAYHVATRRFLTGLEAPWIDGWRRRLEEVRLRGLECFAAAGLGLGGPDLAEALRAYERLRVLLRDELGIAPSPALQDLHRRLLQGADGGS
jgi:DNA-binding SARP family transcriptional activator